MTRELEIQRARALDLDSMHRERIENRLHQDRTLALFEFGLEKNCFHLPLTAKNLTSLRFAHTHHDDGKELIPWYHRCGYLPPDVVMEIFGPHALYSVGLNLRKLEEPDAEGLRLIFDHHWYTRLFDYTGFYDHLPDPRVSTRLRDMEAIVVVNDRIDAAMFRRDWGSEKSREDIYGILDHELEQYTKHLYPLSFSHIDIDPLITEALRMKSGHHAVPDC